MKKIILGFLILLLSFVLSPVQSFSGEMSGGDYIISTNEIGMTGTTSQGGDFLLLGIGGQPTPSGVSLSDTEDLEAGYIYATLFSRSPSDLIPIIIPGIEELLPGLNKQAKKKVQLAVKFLEKALAALEQFEADPVANANDLANALNEIKSAIKKLDDSGADTDGFEEILAQAAELMVTTEINRLAFEAVNGESDLSIIQSRLFLNDGTIDLLDGFYLTAVQSFVQAYNEALLAA